MSPYALIDADREERRQLHRHHDRQRLREIGEVGGELDEVELQPVRGVIRDGHEDEVQQDLRYLPAVEQYVTERLAITVTNCWTPLEGPYLGFLITHGKSISIPDYFTVRDGEGDTVRYRPTCHYAYHPCDDAVLSLHESPGRIGDCRPASG